MQAPESPAGVKGARLVAMPTKPFGIKHGEHQYTSDKEFEQNPLSPKADERTHHGKKRATKYGNTFTPGKPTIARLRHGIV